MSHAPHPASDIVVGSRWDSRSDRGFAIVRCSAAGYIEYVRQDGRRGRAHHETFRNAFISPYDSREVRSRFSMSLANLIELHAFWSPATHHLFARSASRSVADSYKPARGSPPLPAEAIYVGTYTHPYPTDGFLNDLNDALASLGTRSAGI